MAPVSIIRKAASTLQAFCQTITGRRYLLFLLAFSIIFYSFLITPGPFVEDDRTNLLLSKAIWERRSFNVAPYFESFSYFKSSLAVPNNFIVEGNEVKTGKYFLAPFLSYPFYYIFGLKGFQILNAIFTALTVVLVFLTCEKIWSDEHTAKLAAMLYLFCTFSVFYAVGAWYQPVFTFFYLLAQYAVISSRTYLFFTASFLTLLTSYYMVVPLSVLFLFVLFKNKGRPKAVAPLAILALLPVIGYAIYYNIGLPEINLERIGSNFIAMFFYRGFLGDEWENTQKALFESSPFLILSFFGFYELRKRNDEKLKILTLSNFAFIIMFSLSNGPSPGWTYSMRYLLPVLPFLTVLSADYIAKFFNPKQVNYLGFSLILSSIVFYRYTLLSFYHPSYNLTLITGYVLMLLLFASGFFHYSKKSRINTLVSMLLMLSIFYSNYVNISDIKEGNWVRGFTSGIAAEIAENTPEDAVVILPRARGFETLIINERILFYYAIRDSVFFNRDFPDGDDITPLKSIVEHFLNEGKPTYIVVLDTDKGIMNFAERYEDLQSKRKLIELRKAELIKLKSLHVQ